METPLILRRGPLSEDDTKKNMLVVVLVVMCEMMATELVYPIAAFMVEDFHIAKSQHDLGYYAGFISSAYGVTQIIFMPMWGRFSDAKGRRMPLLFGIAGACTSMLLLGFSSSLEIAILFRAIQGAVSGNSSIVKTIVGDLSRDSQLAKKFSSQWGIAYGIGRTLSACIAGFLSRPHRNFPKTFKPGSVFHTYPYLLPCLVSSIFMAVTFVIAFIYFKETKDHANDSSLATELLTEEERSRSIDSVDSPELRPPPQTVSDILSQPKARALVIIVTAMWLSYIMYDDALGVWALSHEHGLNWKPIEMGLFFLINGAMTTLFHLIIYPRLSNRYSAGSMVTWGAFGNMVTFLMFPVAQIAKRNVNAAFSWTIIVVATFGLVCASNALSLSTIILVNNSADGPALGTLNGIVQGAIGASKVVGPLIGASSVAWSFNMDSVFPFNSWFLFVLLALLQVVIMYVNNKYRCYLEECDYQVPEVEPSFISKCWTVFAGLYRSSNVSAVFKRPSSNMSCLDGIRALALLWVITDHTLWAGAEYVKAEHKDSYMSFVHSPLMRVPTNGGMGVTMFFVLSGYLIAHVLLRSLKKTNSMNIKNFLYRRFLRLWPTLVFAMLFYYLWARYYFFDPVTNINYVVQCRKSWWNTMLFIGNFFQYLLGFGSCGPHMWSIAVEFQFYLVSPLFVYLYWKRPAFGHLSAWAAFFLSLLIRLIIMLEYRLPQRWLTYDGTWDYNSMVYQRSYTRASEYLVGMIACFYVHQYKQREVEGLLQPTSPLVSVLQWAVVIVFGFGEAWLGTLNRLNGNSLPGHLEGNDLYVARGFVIVLSHAVFATGQAQLMYLMLTGRAVWFHRVLSSKVLYSIAAVSYSAYLFQFVPMLMMAKANSHYLSHLPGLYYVMNYICAVVLNLLLSFFINVWIERPFMNLRDVNCDTCLMPPKANKYKDHGNQDSMSAQQYDPLIHKV